MSENEVKTIFEDSGIKSIGYDDNIYKIAGLEPIPLKQSKSMWQFLEATALKTSLNLNNLVMTTASTSQTTFYNAMNKAYMEVSTGLKSYSQTILDTIKDIGQNGATVQYPSGRKMSLESAVRMNILTSTNQTCGKLQEMRADELGWDLMELTAHSGARPEHAEWQGRIVSRSRQRGYLSLDDIGYGEVTGFKGINCKHDWRPFYEGSTKTYSDKDLQNFKNEKVTYNGKEISKYDATQIQRRMERTIRQDKKDVASLEGILKSNTNDSKLLEETKNKLFNKKNKLKEHNTILNDFVKQTGLRKDYTRLKVASVSIGNNLDIPKIHKDVKLLLKDAKINSKTKKLLNKYVTEDNSLIDYNLEIPMRYSGDRDKIIINPKHKDFQYYDVPESLTHEVMHMIDNRKNITLSNSDFIQNEINMAKIEINNNKEKYLNLFMNNDEYKENMTLSDIFSAITNNELHGNFYHNSDKWMIHEVKYKEVVANILTAEITDNKITLEVIKEIKPLQRIKERLLKEYEIIR